MAGSYDNLGLVYKAQGNFPKAFETFEKSLEIKLKTLGSEDSETKVVRHLYGDAAFKASEHWTNINSREAAPSGRCMPVRVVHMPHVDSRAGQTYQEGQAVAYIPHAALNATYRPWAPANDALRARRRTRRKRRKRFLLVERSGRQTGPPPLPVKLVVLAAAALAAAVATASWPESHLLRMPFGARAARAR